MSLHINLEGFGVEVQDVPPLPQTEGKPGKVLVFTDQADTGIQVTFLAPQDLANELAAELAGKEPTPAVDVPTSAEVQEFSRKKDKP